MGEISKWPDEHGISKKNDSPDFFSRNRISPNEDSKLTKSGHLLITARQEISTARLTATASEARYVGNSWIPVSGLSVDEVKALAAFLNSTFDRFWLKRFSGKQLAFPTYSTKEFGNLRIPNIKD